MMFARAVLVAAVIGGSAGGAMGAGGDVADGELVAAYAPLEVVAIMPEPGQTLLWNEIEKQYELAKVGQTVAGWKVVAIEVTRVVVMNGAERDELALVLPPAEVRPALKNKAPRKLPTTVITLDDTTSAESPPATEKPVAEKPVAEKPVAEKPAEPPAAAQPAAVDEKHAMGPRVVTRAELDRELGDFDRLLGAVDVASLEGGGFTLTRVEQGSWPARMGLQAGDVVRAVAGETVTTIDDAARVYARLRTLVSFAIDIDRNGQRVTLQYDVVKPKRP